MNNLTFNTIYCFHKYNIYIFLKTLCVSDAVMMGGDDLIEDERSRIIEHLQTGTEMMVYQQRAERLTVQVMMETMQVALIGPGDKIVTACKFLP